MLRSAQVGFALVVFVVLTSAEAAFACGPGCHFAPSGACVRDGWDQAMPVRNECPATTRPQPSCGGPGLRWDRRKLACFPS